MHLQFVFLVTFLLYWLHRGIHSFWKSRLQAKNEVPFGFKGFPGIGFLPNFKGYKSRQKIIAIREKYGGICKVRLGSFDCVWLNDYNLIKEAWVNSAFCGRPDLEGISLRSRGFKGGIIFNDGKAFKEQRQFVIHTLRAIGMGTNLSEKFISEEMHHVIKTLSQQAGFPVSTRHLFNIPVFNIIWRLITGGARLRHDNPEMSKLVHVLNRNMELNDGACAAFFMPWLSKLLPRLIGWKNYVSDANFIFDFWLRFAENLRDQDDLSDMMTGGTIYKDSFLWEYCEKIEKCRDPASSFHGDKGVKSLATVLQDLFIAGSETTATTLQWICLYLAAFPTTQQLIFDEIKLVLGEAFHIDTLSAQQSHRNRLPYTEAFIKESLRFSTLAPLGMVHSTMEDVQLREYFIPKGALLHMNVCAVHFDKKHWKEPETFDPDRFLTPEGKLRTGEIPGYLPFSLGRRMCPGAEIARQTLFSATVHIIKNFEIHYVHLNIGDTSKGIELNPKIGVSATPFPHELLFKIRSVN